MVRSSRLHREGREFIAEMLDRSDFSVGWEAEESFVEDNGTFDRKCDLYSVQIIY